MKYPPDWSIEEDGLPVLSGVLVAGLLIHFTIDPGGAITDLVNVVVPSVVVIGLLSLAIWLHFRTPDVDDVARISRFGWIGAIGTGLVATLLITVHLAVNSPVYRTSDEVVTLLSIGIGTGVLVGTIKNGVESQGGVFHSDVGLNEAPEQAFEQLVVHAELTWTSRQGPNPILTTIVEAIAEIEGCDPLELEPVSSHIDPDTFDSLRQKPGSQWQVLFQALGYEILVNSCGTVLVYENVRGETQYLNEVVER